MSKFAFFAFANSRTNEAEQSENGPSYTFI